jgi:hypothetical protein
MVQHDLFKDFDERLDEWANSSDISLAEKRLIDSVQHIKQLEQTISEQKEKIYSLESVIGLNNNYMDSIDKENNHLRSLISRFFEMLDRVEESDSGKEFHPITIGCSRALMIAPLDKLLSEMKFAACLNKS